MRGSGSEWRSSSSSDSQGESSEEEEEEGEKESLDPAERGVLGGRARGAFGSYADLSLLRTFFPGAASFRRL